MPTESTSKWIPGRYPAPGTSTVGDAIRKRRGERGITPLDAALLHVPPVADGWNTLLGAVRTKGLLGGDVRELMICRVAAINGAAFEWIHHEPVARQHGLTTAQLYIIRDFTTPLPPAHGILNPLQAAALAFSDASTRVVIVPDSVTETLRSELRKWVLKENSGLSEDEVKEKTDDLFVEASLITASYNMVSRFLVAVDVAGFSREEVPWPLDREEHFALVPQQNPTHTIHTVVLKTSPSAPYIVFINSLVTDFTMWSLVVPYFIAKEYNLVLLSQRGHGKSTLPSAPSSESDKRLVTIPLLAFDIHTILTSHLNISLQDIKSIIGVSQGGATTLALAALYKDISSSIIVCDTAPRTPAGNQSAWEERIQLVNGDQLGGMKRLADITIPRWFPLGSPISPQSQSQLQSQSSKKEKDTNKGRAEWVSSMITSTPVSGFEAGARALGSYDIISLGIFDSPMKNVLLLAGRLDGAGKVGEGLKRFGDEWNEKRKVNGGKEVEFVLVDDAGHLPMIDQPEEFWKVVGRFLKSF